MVADTTLIEQLWSDGDQPVDPVNALQTRVSKVRRALAAAGSGELLTRQGAGYRLDVDPAGVDVHRFTASIDRARRAGAADEAIRLYDAALAEWRAEPFVDFAGEPWAAVETTRLVELRLAAIAERAERMLTLGRYEELVADLEPVVAGAPTRERLVGQLMTGLFNAGRQADALEVYARTRQVLADELGLDPSRELRGLMEQILRQDTAITPAAASPSTVLRADPDGRAPGNLPLRLTSFVGRDDDLDRVLEALRGARLVTLAGPGGAGKTSLGVEAARRAGPGFADGVWLVRLAPVTEPEMLVHAVADGVGVEHRGRNGGPPAAGCARRPADRPGHADRAGQLRAPDRTGRRAGAGHPGALPAGADPGDQPGGARRARRGSAPGCAAAGPLRRDPIRAGPGVPGGPAVPGPRGRGAPRPDRGRARCLMRSP